MRSSAIAVSAWSPVDILVLNASIELPEPFDEITRERFDRQLIESALAQCGGKVVEAAAAREWVMANAKTLKVKPPKVMGGKVGLNIGAP